MSEQRAELKATATGRVCPNKARADRLEREVKGLTAMVAKLARRGAPTVRAASRRLARLPDTYGITGDSEKPDKRTAEIRRLTAAGVPLAPDDGLPDPYGLKTEAR